MAGVDYDALVVGYGPAGATLANLLGQRGLRVAVFDQAAQIYDKPRAITADHEVMRVFQACGLADEIAAVTTPHPGTDFVGIEGQVIKRFYPAPPPQPLAWEPSWMFVQPQLEATLRRGVQRFDKVDTFLQHEFVGCEQTADAVTARFKRLADGTTTSVTAKYLVGSDGARSTVRQAMAATIEDLAFDEWWIVVDAWITGALELPERCVQYCRPSRPGTYIVGPDNLRRWEIKMLPGETPQDFESPQAVMKVLASFVDTTQLELCRVAIYRFHALVVDQWRFGRVFLMGDAAHQMPPFLGQGLCAGIRDAVNLAWKLDAVERAGCSPALLDTYGQERKPHVRTIVAHAKTFGLIIGELNVEAARRRDQDLGAQLAAGTAPTVRQQFIPVLETGLIARHPQGGKQRGAGDLFVQPWVTREGVTQRLDDALPEGFWLVADSPEPLAWLDADAAHTLARLGGQRVMLADKPEAADPSVACLQPQGELLHTWLAGLDAHAVIVRPDRYVFGVANNASELRALLAQLHAALFAPTAVEALGAVAAVA